MGSQLWLKKQLPNNGTNFALHDLETLNLWAWPVAKWLDHT